MTDSSGMYHDQHPSGLHGGVRAIFLGADGLVRPGWRAILFVAFGVVASILLQGALGGATRGMSDALKYTILSAANIAVILLESWFLLSVFDRRSFRTLGLSIYPGCGKETGLGLAFGAALIVATTAILAGSGLVSYHGTGDGAGEIDFLVWGGVLILAAAFEEILLRGYLLQRLCESITPTGGLVVTSALFAAGHLGNPSINYLAMLNTFLAGILLGVAYLKTRALWLPIALHWSWNYLMGPILSLPVSGLSMWKPMFVVQVHAPDWLSGGAYGPEGSAILSGVLVAATLGLGRWKGLQPSAAMREILKLDSLEPAKGVE